MGILDLSRVTCDELTNSTLHGGVSVCECGSSRCAVNHENKDTAYKVLKQKHEKDNGQTNIGNNISFDTSHATRYNTPHNNSNYNHCPTSVIYHQAMKQIDNLWQDFNVNNYRHLWNKMKYKNTKCTITIPEPFALHPGNKVRTTAMLQLDEERRSKQMQEILECSMQFKAKPVPHFIKKSSFCENNKSNNGNNITKIENKNKFKKKNPLLKNDINKMNPINNRRRQCKVNNTNDNKDNKMFDNNNKIDTNIINNYSDNNDRIEYKLLKNNNTYINNIKKNIDNENNRYFSKNNHGNKTNISNHYKHWFTNKNVDIINNMKNNNIKNEINSFEEYDKFNKKDETDDNDNVKDNYFNDDDYIEDNNDNDYVEEYDNKGEEISINRKKIKDKYVQRNKNIHLPIHDCSSHPLHHQQLQHQHPQHSQESKQPQHQHPQHSQLSKQPQHSQHTKQSEQSQQQQNSQQPQNLQQPQHLQQLQIRQTRLQRRLTLLINSCPLSL